MSGCNASLFPHRIVAGLNKLGKNTSVSGVFPCSYVHTNLTVKQKEFGEKMVAVFW